MRASRSGHPRGRMSGGREALEAAGAKQILLLDFSSEDTRPRTPTLGFRLVEVGNEDDLVFRAREAVSGGQRELFEISRASTRRSGHPQMRIKQRLDERHRG